jgi:predicted site-specific integrase-resolvase
LAEKLDLPYATVLRYCREGWLASYRFSHAPNGRFRIRPADAEAFVERARREAAA